jgi:hypothetical protein
MLARRVAAMMDRRIVVVGVDADVGVVVEDDTSVVARMLWWWSTDE